MFQSTGESCVMCGGDGRIHNAFGAHKTCPGCGGTGRRHEDYGQRDVTKTKSTQGRAPGAKATEKAAEPAKPTGPTTLEGAKLAAEIKACAALPEITRTRLYQELLAHEQSHGTTTQTFAKKLRKTLRAAGAGGT